MDWFSFEPLRLFCPDFADVFDRCQAPEPFQSPCIVMGSDKVGQVGFQLCMGIVMISLDGGLFDRPVHAPGLSVGPGMVHLCQPVFDLMVCANTIEDVFEGKPVLLAIGELDAVVGQDGVDPAAIRLRGNWAAIIFPARSCNSTQASLDVRSMATNSLILPAPVRGPAMST